MSAFAVGLLEARARRLGLWVAVVVVLAAAAGALVSYASAQPQLVKAGLLAVGAAALLLLAVRLPVSVLPLALVVGLLGLGNMELCRILAVPVLGGQEKWVLLILAGVAVLGVALDVSAPIRPKWPAVLLLGGLFLTVCIASLFYAADRELAGGAVIHQVVQMAALAAGFFWVRRISQANALVACLAILALLSAALGLSQYLSPRAFNNVFGDFASPTMRTLMDLWALDIGRVGALWVFAPPLAALLSALLPCFLWLWFRGGGRGLAWLAASGFGLCAVVLALTGTRAALAGGVLATGVFLSACGLRSSGFSRVWAGALPVLTGAIVVATLLSARGTAESNTLGRLLYLFQGDAGTSTSVSARKAIYTTMIESWRSDPILGVGLGNTQSAVQDVTTYNSSPHSYWLGLLAETGLVGTGLVALMLAGMVPHYRRLLARARGSPRRGLAVLALAASTALLVSSLLDNAMLAWQIGVLFWLLQGAVLSLSLRCEDGSRSDTDWEERSI